MFYRSNGSLAVVTIPRPLVNDSGKYKIECISYGSPETNNHVEEILLHVIKGNRTSHNPTSSVTPTEAKNDLEKSMESNSTGTTTGPSTTTPIKATTYTASPSEPTISTAGSKSEPSQRSATDEVVIALTVVLSLVVMLIVVCYCYKTRRFQRRRQQWSPATVVEHPATEANNEINSTRV